MPAEFFYSAETYGQPRRIPLLCNEETVVNISHSDPILCVDLDGSLIHSNSLWDSMVLLAKTRAFSLLLVPFWGLRGRAWLKHQIALRTSLNAESLPYRRDLLNWLRSQKSAGRRIALVTGANHRIANAVAQHLAVFDAVHASDASLNLTGEARARHLQNMYGSDGFRIVDASQERPQHWLFSLLKCMRPHQWSKNLLLFVPLLLSFKFTDGKALASVLIGVFSFSLCASAVYLINDLLDLESDRTHPKKRRRPIAAGTLPVPVVLVAIPFLLIASAMAAASISPAFMNAVVAYFLVTLAYSIHLKQLAIIDVLILAVLYMWRIFVGAIAIEVDLTPWLAAFSVFFFLSLALAKRVSELILLDKAQGNIKSARDYQPEDRSLLTSFGAASAHVAVLVLALFIYSPDVARLYRYPKALWLICPALLYWISRLWLLVQRGILADDPVLFAIRDSVSWKVFGVIILVWILAHGFF